MRKKFMQLLAGLLLMSSLAFGAISGAVVGQQDKKPKKDPPGEIIKKPKNPPQKPEPPKDKDKPKDKKKPE